MRPRLPRLLVRRSWWWVFGLCIAAPALVLALLSLNALRADEIERRDRLRKDHAQIARLADTALSTALNRSLAATSRESGHGVPVSGGIAFDVDDSGQLAFPSARVIVGPLDTLLPDAIRLAPEIADLVERARAADAQGRTSEASALYERLRTTSSLRAWADWQLTLLRSDLAQPAAVTALAAPALAETADRSPSGIPLAVIACSLVDGVAPKDNVRTAFAPLLVRTLQNLRAGRWWMRLEQRRAYDSELRRWLVGAGVQDVSSEDSQLSALARVASVIGDAFANSRRLPRRAQVVSADGGQMLLVWVRPAQPADPWTGVAIADSSMRTLFSDALVPLVRDVPFKAALRDGDAAVWGEARASTDQRIPLESVSGWALTFVDPPAPAFSTRSLLDYGRVLFPIVVLGCGLVMTVWIVRRELALTELQSTFVAAVSHEFKSPITSIRLMKERLSGGRLAPGESTEPYLAAIGAETDRLEGLVNRLLDAQKVQAGQKTYAFRPTDLGALARDIVTRMRAQADEKGIALHLRNTSDVPSVAIDEESVSDALRNLVDNAIKYSPANSQVSIALTADAGRVCVEVADEGLGVEPAERERIFEPFYRSPRGDRANVHGTGLGLSLVKATADAHGGSVRVESDGRRGSAFILTLPVSRGRVVDDSTSPADTRDIGVTNGAFNRPSSRR